jgi:hypothetical protein
MNKSQILAFAILLVTACTAPAATISPSTMNRNTRQVFDESMHWDEHFFDTSVHLVRRPEGGQHETVALHHMVRESSWYALGLLMRDASGDRERASEILDAILQQQFRTRGVRWYGTFRRSPEEPDPQAKSEMWRGYDPNWREFIGTTFALILNQYPDRIEPAMAQRLYSSIDVALQGEMDEKRLVPGYSNIALMYGFLWDFAAQHDHNPVWQKESAEWTESVYRLFKQHDAFDEYNSPTYYGVDLYGLALWRSFGSNPRMRTLGSEMEATLWSDIADFYQPELRNISGPYDRSYGMDMESYVSLVGIWMRTALDASIAPLPELNATTDHLADLWLAPHIALLGTRIPSDAFARMQLFQGDHLIRKQITNDRVATAWISHKLLFGGEATNLSKDSGTTTQFHPAAVQWRTPSGPIGWIRMVQSPPVNAIADRSGLTIVTKGLIRLRLHAKDLVATKITAQAWDLPGLHVSVISDAKGFAIKSSGDEVDIIYPGLTHMRLNIQTSTP